MKELSSPNIYQIFPYKPHKKNILSQGRALLIFLFGKQGKKKND